MCTQIVHHIRPMRAQSRTDIHCVGGPRAALTANSAVHGHHCLDRADDRGPRERLEFRHPRVRPSCRARLVPKPLGCSQGDPQVPPPIAP